MIRRTGLLFLLIISMFYLAGCEFFQSNEKEEITIDNVITYLLIDLSIH